MVPFASVQYCPAARKRRGRSTHGFPSAVVQGVDCKSCLAQETKAQISLCSPIMLGLTERGVLPNLLKGAT